MTAVAELGHFALTSPSLVTLFRRAAEMLEAELGLEPVRIVRGATGGVPILTGDAEPWGAIVFAEREDIDLDLLRAVASIVGQAIVRERAEDAVLVRARQQSAIAELSRLTVKPVTPLTLTRACDLIIERLGVDHALYFALERETQMLRFQAGNRWFSDELCNLPLTATSQGAECVTRNSPVIVDDYMADTRFAATRSLFIDTVRSGVVVPVTSARGCRGIIAAQTRTPRTFNDDDIFFVEAIANLLGEALERDDVQHELAVSEDRYRDIIEAASDIIFTIAPDGRLLALNSAFERVTGLQVSSWIGRFAQDLVEDASVQNILDEVAMTAAAQQSEITVAGAYGPVILELSVIPQTHDGMVSAIHGFGRDVTAERQAEIQNRNLQAKLEQANRIAGLGKLAATVAHEFNNVLMGISPFIDVMRRGKNLETSLDHISRAVQRGRRITQDILRYTQPAEPTRTDIDLESWMQTVVVDAQSLVTNSHTVRFNGCGEKLWVNADGTQLQQVLTNLILNARDAMPGGGSVTIELRRETPETKFRFSVRNPETFAHLIVRDTGCGMNEEMLRHAFEPLFTTKRNGTGLGLPVALQVVQRHGGELFVESTPGIGTTFHIFLPLTVPKAFAGPQEVPAEVNTSKAKLVVLVEDDPIVATGLVGLLSMEGMAVRLVKTGTEAMQILSRIRPDLVILDVGLPDMDGMQVFTTLGNALRDVPVIFSTGHADRSKLEALLARPNVGFLLKPYKHSDLLEMIWQVTTEAAA